MSSNSGSVPPAEAIPVRHLAALRRLLRREFLASTEVVGALAEIAITAEEVLAARRAFVALWNQETAAWRAVGREGAWIEGDEFRLFASLSLLERTREGSQPLLAVDELPPLLRSESSRRHELRAVLVHPVWRWESGARSPVRRFAGCLYADRSEEEGAFAEPEVEIVEDLARLTEKTLGLLGQMGRLEERLSVYRSEVERERAAARAAFVGEHVESVDPRFRAAVVEPLERAAGAGQVGVLLLGPTGSGKTHLAELFHRRSRRRAGPFVTLDCSQVTSAEALAAELFGYARKSGFAEAPPEGRPGKARLADGGTLFLDEIGSLPRELQPRLLRVIEAGRFSPLGTSEEQCVDLSIVAASSDDLEAAVARGAFRPDLYYRLAELTLRVPSLDERAADLPRIAGQFLARTAARHGRSEVVSLAPAALERLAHVRWSAAGNLRGLEHTISRSVLFAPLGRTRLEAEDLVLHGASPLVAARSAATLTESVAATPRDEALAGLLDRKLREHRGVVARLAEDPEVALAFRLDAPPVPASSVLLALRRLGLQANLERTRREAGPNLEAVRAAVVRQRSAAAAARELGMTRDQVSWVLRRAGLSVRTLLAESD